MTSRRLDVIELGIRVADALDNENNGPFAIGRVVARAEDAQNRSMAALLTAARTDPSLFPRFVPPGPFGLHSMERD